MMVALGWAAPCFATAEGLDPSLPADGRIKTLAYDEGDVYIITTKYGYQTNIVFASNEEIETISVGERSLWQIIPAANRLFIRPMQENISTNMTVLTNRRAYQFDLKSVGMTDKDANNIYVAKFIYPDDRKKGRPPMMMAPPPDMAPPPPSLPPQATPMMPEMPPVEPTATSGPGVTQPVYPNYNYTYSGPDTLAPLQVFDNGRATFIKYHTLPQPMPEIYIVDASGQQQRVAADIKDSMLVVDAIAGTLALKQDTGTITIYNEMLNSH